MLTKQFNDIVKAVALEVGGKIDRQNSSKVMVESKRLLQRRRNMEISNRDKTELANTITKNKDYK